VRKGSHEGEWSVRFADGFPLDELRRDFPSDIFSESEALPWDYQVLCALLRRAAEISICVPDAPLAAFQKELDYVLDTQGITKPPVDRCPAPAIPEMASGASFYGESW